MTNFTPKDEKMTDDIGHYTVGELRRTMIAMGALNDASIVVLRNDGSKFHLASTAWDPKTNILKLIEKDSGL